MEEGQFIACLKKADKEVTLEERDSAKGVMTDAQREDEIRLAYDQEIKDSHSINDE